MSDEDGRYVQDGPELEISNEFAIAKVRKVQTRNGDRLEISSRRLGYSVLLDALELEALSWQTHDKLSKLLEQPGGPEGGGTA